MSLNNAKVIRLNEDGSHGKVYMCKGHTFTFGYLTQSDCILDNGAAVMSEHCRITHNERGKAFLQNFGDKGTVELDGVQIDDKEYILKEKSHIKIYDATFLWEYPKNAEQNVFVAQLNNSNSCTHKKYPVGDFTKRMTIHSFGCAVGHDSEPDSSYSDLSQSMSETLIMAEKELNESSAGAGVTPLEPTEQNIDEKPCNPDMCKYDLIDFTPNKSNSKSFNKSLERSHIFITAYPPCTKYSVENENSFEGVITPASLRVGGEIIRTPRSVCATPMHSMEFTTPNRDQMRTKSSVPQTLYKSFSKNSSFTIHEGKIVKKANLSTSLQPVLKVIPPTPKTPQTPKVAATPTMDESIISICSSNTATCSSSVISISASDADADSIPGSSAAITAATTTSGTGSGTMNRLAITPKRKKQESLIKSAILRSAKKKAMRVAIGRSPLKKSPKAVNSGSKTLPLSLTFPGRSTTSSPKSPKISPISKTQYSLRQPTKYLAPNISLQNVEINEFTGKDTLSTSTPLRPKKIVTSTVTATSAAKTTTTATQPTNKNMSRARKLIMLSTSGKEKSVAGTPGKDTTKITTDTVDKALDKVTTELQTESASTDTVIVNLCETDKQPNAFNDNKVETTNQLEINEQIDNINVTEKLETTNKTFQKNTEEPIEINDKTFEKEIKDQNSENHAQDHIQSSNKTFEKKDEEVIKTANKTFEKNTEEPIENKDKTFEKETKEPVDGKDQIIENHAQDHIESSNKTFENKEEVVIKTANKTIEDDAAVEQDKNNMIEIEDIVSEVSENIHVAECFQNNPVSDVPDLIDDAFYSKGKENSKKPEEIEVLNQTFELTTNEEEIEVSPALEFEEMPALQYEIDEYIADEEVEKHQEVNVNVLESKMDDKQEFIEGSKGQEETAQEANPEETVVAKFSQTSAKNVDVTVNEENFAAACISLTDSQTDHDRPSSQLEIIEILDKSDYEYGKEVPDTPEVLDTPPIIIHKNEDNINDDSAQTIPETTEKVSVQQGNLSAEEAFDELIGTPSTVLHTPVSKTYARKILLGDSLSKQLPLSPFSATDVITDLPKTDVEEWLDTVEASAIDPLEPTEIEMTLENNATVNKDETKDPLMKTVLQSATKQHEKENRVDKENQNENEDEDEDEKNANPADISGLELLDALSDELIESLTLSDSEEEVDKENPQQPNEVNKTQPQNVENFEAEFKTLLTSTPHQSKGVMKHSTVTKESEIKECIEEYSEVAKENAEFINFDQNAIINLQNRRSATPLQHKQRTKLRRKTLGSQEEIRVTFLAENTTASVEKRIMQTISEPISENEYYDDATEEVVAKSSALETKTIDEIKEVEEDVEGKSDEMISLIEFDETTENITENKSEVIDNKEEQASSNIVNIQNETAEEEQESRAISEEPAFADERIIAIAEPETLTVPKTEAVAVANASIDSSPPAIVESTKLNQSIETDLMEQPLQDAVVLEGQLDNVCEKNGKLIFDNVNDTTAALVNDQSQKIHNIEKGEIMMEKDETIRDVENDSNVASVSFEEAAVNQDLEAENSKIADVAASVPESLEIVAEKEEAKSDHDPEAEESKIADVTASAIESLKNVDENEDAIVDQDLEADDSKIADAAISVAESLAIFDKKSIVDQDLEAADSKIAAVAASVPESLEIFAEKEEAIADQDPEAEENKIADMAASAIESLENVAEKEDAIVDQDLEADDSKIADTALSVAESFAIDEAFAIVEAIVDQALEAADTEVADVTISVVEGLENVDEKEEALGDQALEAADSKIADVTISVVEGLENVDDSKEAVVDQDLKAEDNTTADMAMSAVENLEIAGGKSVFEEDKDNNASITDSGATLAEHAQVTDENENATTTVGVDDSLVYDQNNFEEKKDVNASAVGYLEQREETFESKIAEVTVSIDLASAEVSEAAVVDQEQTEETHEVVKPEAVKSIGEEILQVVTNDAVEEETPATAAAEVNGTETCTTTEENEVINPSAQQKETEKILPIVDADEAIIESTAKDIKEVAASENVEIPFKAEIENATENVLVVEEIKNSEAEIKVEEQIDESVNNVDSQAAQKIPEDKTTVTTDKVQEQEDAKVATDHNVEDTIRDEVKEDSTTAAVVNDAVSEAEEVTKIAVKTRRGRKASQSSNTSEKSNTRTSKRKKTIDENKESELASIEEKSIIANQEKDEVVDKEPQTKSQLESGADSTEIRDDIVQQRKDEEKSTKSAINHEDDDSSATKTTKRRERTVSETSHTSEKSSTRTSKRKKTIDENKGSELASIEEKSIIANQEKDEVLDKEPQTKSQLDSEADSIETRDDIVQQRKDEEKSTKSAINHEDDESSATKTTKRRERTVSETSNMSEKSSTRTSKRKKTIDENKEVELASIEEKASVEEQGNGVVVDKEPHTKSQLDSEAGSTETRDDIVEEPKDEEKSVVKPKNLEEDESHASKTTRRRGRKVSESSDTSEKSSTRASKRKKVVETKNSELASISEAAASGEQEVAVEAVTKDTEQLDDKKHIEAETTEIRKHAESNIEEISVPKSDENIVAEDKTVTKTTIRGRGRKGSQCSDISEKSSTRASKRKKATETKDVEMTVISETTTLKEKQVEVEENKESKLNIDVEENKESKINFTEVEKDVVMEHEDIEVLSVTKPAIDTEVDATSASSYNKRTTKVQQKKIEEIEELLTTKDENEAEVETKDTEKLEENHDTKAVSSVEIVDKPVNKPDEQITEDDATAPTKKATSTRRGRKASQSTETSEIRSSKRKKVDQKTSEESVKDNKYMVNENAAEDDKKIHIDDNNEPDVGVKDVEKHEAETVSDEKQTTTRRGRKPTPTTTTRVTGRGRKPAGKKEVKPNIEEKAGKEEIVIEISSSTDDMQDMEAVEKKEEIIVQKRGRKRNDSHRSAASNEAEVEVKEVKRGRGQKRLQQEEEKTVEDVTPAKRGRRKQDKHQDAGEKEEKKQAKKTGKDEKKQKENEEEEEKEDVEKEKPEGTEKEAQQPTKSVKVDNKKEEEVKSQPKRGRRPKNTVEPKGETKETTTEAEPADTAETKVTTPKSRKRSNSQKSPAAKSDGTLDVSPRREVPQRAVTAIKKNYDESSDVECYQSSRGRVRKPTPLVEEFLQKQRSTPTRRGPKVLETGTEKVETEKEDVAGPSQAKRRREENEKCSTPVIEEKAPAKVAAKRGRKKAGNDDAAHSPAVTEKIEATPKGTDKNQSAIKKTPVETPKASKPARGRKVVRFETETVTKESPKPALTRGRKKEEEPKRATRTRRN